MSLFKKLYWFLMRHFGGLDGNTRAKKLGVKIGDRCQIHLNTNFGSEPFFVEIGNHVKITDKVSFITHDGGCWVFRDEHPGIDLFGRIKIGDNVFIGNGTTILYGVTIGNNCIIGANSLITKSFPDNCIIGGSPAKIIGQVDSFFEKYQDKFVRTHGIDPKEKKEKIMNLPLENFVQR